MDDEVFGEPYGNGEDITLMEAMVQMKRKSLEYFFLFFDLGVGTRGGRGASIPEPLVEGRVNMRPRTLVCC